MQVLNDRRLQVEKKVRIALVLLGPPNMDQAIVDLILRHYPELTILYRCVDNQPLWIQRGRPPMEATST